MPIRIAWPTPAGLRGPWFVQALMLALLSSSAAVRAQVDPPKTAAPAPAPAPSDNAPTPPKVLAANHPIETAKAMPVAEPQLGHVLAVQVNDVILDLSEVQGLSRGASVELWRPIKLKHPVTGRLIQDRFQIGRLSITQVRPHMSLAVPDGVLDRPAEPGDVVIASPRPPDPAVVASGVVVAAGRMQRSPAAEPELPNVAPAQAARVPTSPPGSGNAVGDGDVRELSALFEQLKGTAPQARITAYARFIKAYPSNRFSAALLEQARVLESLVDEENVSESAELERHEPPLVALVGQPLSLAVQLRTQQVGVLVHFKRPSQTTFQSQPARRAAGNFFAMTLPGAAVHGDGLQYFMEVVGKDGRSRPLVGTSASPVSVVTRHDWDTSAPQRPAATVQFVADYADYNRLRNNDRDWRLEGDFGLRLGDLGLRALRSGFGVYRGVGGSLFELDELDKSPRAVGLTYGYLEAEYAFDDGASVIGRALLGLDDNGVSGGLQAHVRIGSDRATNVTLGGELLGDIGVRGITQLTIAPLSRFPIVVRSEVGNQPAGATPSASEVRPLEEGASLENTSLDQSDVGVRGIVQVGYRVLPELVLCARASYQGRNIKHSGPGFGGAVLYSW